MRGRWPVPTSRRSCATPPVGKRARQRARGGASAEPGGPLAPGLETPQIAPSSSYADAEAGELELRNSLTARARAEYNDTLAGGHHREDAWQRATELLFERLAVAWTISGLRIDRQRELLGRYRMASAAERRFVRDSLRSHLQANFPELQAP